MARARWYFVYLRISSRELIRQVGIFNFLYGFDVFLNGVPLGKAGLVAYCIIHWLL